MHHCPICDDDQITSISPNGYCPDCERRMSEYAKDPRTPYQRQRDEETQRDNQRFVNQTRREYER